MQNPDPLSPLELGGLRPEFALILAAVRFHLGHLEAADLEPYLDRALDEKLLLKAAHWHRLGGVLFKVLRQQGRDRVSPASLKALEQAYRHNAGRNLQLSALLFQLLERLKQAGIPALVIKGLALAGPLYGDLALRRSSDLDLLIDPRHVAGAMRLICALEGCTTEPLSPYALKVLMRTDCELKLEMHGLLIELQWGLAPLDRFYPVSWSQLLDEADTFKLANRELATLGSVETLPYLCFHGTKHLWYRLFWLADVAAWLAHRPWSWEQVRDRAAQRRNLRALLLGLALSRHLFASPLPEGALALLRNEPELLDRVGHLRRQLLPEADVPYDPEVSDWVWWKNIYWMYPEWGQRAAISWRYLCQPTLKDLEAFSLPPALGGLYYGIRPLRLGASALRMARRKKPDEERGPSAT